MKNMVASLANRANPAKIIALAGHASDMLIVLGKDNEAVGYGMLCDLATGSHVAPTAGPNPTVRWSRDGLDVMKLWIDARTWQGKAETAILMRRCRSLRWTPVCTFSLA